MDIPNMCESKKGASVQALGLSSFRATQQPYNWLFSVPLTVSWSKQLCYSYMQKNIFVDI